MNILAIDIGGTKLTMAIFEDDRMIVRERRPTNRSGGRVWMLEQITGIASVWAERPGFAACGIGFGGPVDYTAQKVVQSTHVEGWRDYPLAAYLSAHLGVPCKVDNDANVGLIGEATAGAGVGCDPLFYMTLSTGIGGALLIGGSVCRGADSYAGEIGHIIVRPDGPQCLCGARGCLERMCCGLWLERDYGEPAYKLMQDPAFVRRYVVDLAAGLKSMVMLLNPARIVIGGGIAKAGEELFLPLRREMRRQITAWSRARLDVVPAALGDDSVLFGAAALALDLL